MCAATCEFPVGPESSSAGCISAVYSPTRLIPPYASDTVSLDWRDWQIVNSVQDQGNCRSNWAFASVAAVESAYAIKQGLLHKFAEQQLIGKSLSIIMISTDCDTTSNSGCKGGEVLPALKYIAENGITLDSDYPYASGITGI